MSPVYPFSSGFRLYSQKGGDIYVPLGRHWIRVLVDGPGHDGRDARILLLDDEEDARNGLLYEREEAHS
jgi:hypothetical protein